MNWLRKFFAFREQSDGDVVKPFLEHLEDLRWTVVKMVLSIIVGMIVAFSFSKQLIAIIEAPLAAIDPALVGNLQVFGAVEGFMITLKLSFYSGIVLSFPLLLFFAAEFVLPALSRQEKKLLIPAIAGGFVLFGFGVLASYYYVLPHTLKFFFAYNVDMGFQNNWRAGEYFSLVTHLTLACGLLCELPVAILSLSALGLVSYKLLSTTRPYAFTLIMILVAVVSPTPDPFTFLALSLPGVAIYEICIWLVWLIERRKRRVEVADADAA
jgi:sec-independent protein translocase protein TatC